MNDESMHKWCARYFGMQNDDKESNDCCLFSFVFNLFDLVHFSKITYRIISQHKIIKLQLDWRHTQALLRTSYTELTPKCTHTHTRTLHRQSVFLSSFLQTFHMERYSFIRVFLATRFDMNKLRRILLFIILLIKSTNRPMLPFYCLLHLDLVFDLDVNFDEYTLRSVSRHNNAYFISSKQYNKQLHIQHTYICIMYNHLKRNNVRQIY